MDLLRVFLKKSQLSCLVGFAEGKRTKDHHSQNWVRAEHVSLGSNFMLALLTVFIREESGKCLSGKNPPEDGGKVKGQGGEK